MYKYHVFCCTNQRPPDAKRECCAAKSSEELRSYMKTRIAESGIKNVRINASGCLDMCEKGPVMVVYPEGVWYSCKNKSEIDKVISEHIEQGRVVKELIVTQE